MSSHCILVSNTYIYIYIFICSYTIREYNIKFGQNTRQGSSRLRPPRSRLSIPPTMSKVGDITLFSCSKHPPGSGTRPSSCTTGVLFACRGRQRVGRQLASLNDWRGFGTRSQTDGNNLFPGNTTSCRVFQLDDLNTKSQSKERLYLK